jgi:hypothetical protein
LAAAVQVLLEDQLVVLHLAPWRVQILHFLQLHLLVVVLQLPHLLVELLVGQVVELHTQPQGMAYLELQDKEMQVEME